MKEQFCRFCGAGIGEFRRFGEGTCEHCDPMAKSPQGEPALTASGLPGTSEVADVAPKGIPIESPAHRSSNQASITSRLWELEKVTCERDFHAWEHIVHDARLEIERLTAELEALKHDIGRHMTIANTYLAERDRLQKLISTVDGMLFDIREHSQGARRIRAYIQQECEALAEHRPKDRPADETTAGSPLEWTISKEGWWVCSSCDQEVIEVLKCTGCGRSGFARASKNGTAELQK